MTTYVVIDVEFDGPIPGVNSMISIGAIAINKQGDELGEFEVNLLPMETAKIDEATMNWFNNEAPEALKYCRKNALKPDQAMTKFGDWLINLPSPRIMAAHPGPTDYMWIHYYILT